MSLPPDASSHLRTGAASVSGYRLWSARIDKALSFRLGCLSLLVAALAGALVGSVWEPLTVPVMIVVGVAAWLSAVCNDEQMAKCDACFKRVKYGAVACHHCGYTRNIA